MNSLRYRGAPPYEATVQVLRVALGDLDDQATNQSKEAPAEINLYQFMVSRPQGK